LEKSIEISKNWHRLSVIGRNVHWKVDLKATSTMNTF
jgi:hypothetical protein